MVFPQAEGATPYLASGWTGRLIDVWSICRDGACVSRSRSSDLCVVPSLLPSLPAHPEVAGSTLCSEAFNSNADLKLVKRDAAWTSKYAMLFIDNPVGAGFSYTTSDAGYCNDSKGCVAENLYSLLQQFYGAFPDQLDVELFITGESYGGHYVPAISAYIHKQNVAMRHRSGLEAAARWNAKHAWGVPAVSVPLGGMAIGDGWVDPVNMVPAYPAMMFNLGLCDEKQRVLIQDYCDRTTAFIKDGRMPSPPYCPWPRAVLPLNAATPSPPNRPWLYAPMSHCHPPPR